MKLKIEKNSLPTPEISEKATNLKETTRVDDTPNIAQTQENDNSPKDSEKGVKVKLGGLGKSKPTTDDVSNKVEDNNGVASAKAYAKEVIAEKQQIPFNNIEIPDFIQIFLDTEFEQNIESGMDNLAIPYFSPQFDFITTVDKDKLSADFDPITELLRQQGFSVEKYPRQQIEEKLTKAFKDSNLKSLSKTQAKKFFKLPKVQKILEKYNLNAEQISLRIDKRNKVCIAFKKIECELQFFFAYADIFRVFGEDAQVIWYENAKLTQFRTIKIMGKVKITRLINGVPTDVIISIFDNRYCLPPIKGSLGDQAVTFGCIDYLENLLADTNNERIKYLLNLTLDKNKLVDSIEDVLGEKVSLDWCEKHYDFIKNATKYLQSINFKTENPKVNLQDVLDKLNLKLPANWAENNKKLIKNAHAWAKAYKDYTEKCSKLKISKRIKEVYGDIVNENWCKSNMSIVRDKYFQVFIEYAEIDTIITWALNQALNELLDRVCAMLDIDPQKLAETCGKNIENILLSLIKNHFGVIEDKSGFNFDNLKDLIKLGRAENLSKNSQNDYGVVPLSTVGGLLFTRTALESIIEGNFFDLDLKSCYATALTSMNLYLGEPIALSFGESNNEKPTVKEVYEKIKKHNIPKDAWFIRVSGRLNKVTNTLILSDSSFKKGENIKTNRKRYEFPEDLDLETEYVNLINAEKISEKSAISKVNYKEINHGIITEATLTALSDLPPEHYEEYLNLKVDFITYYKPELSCSSTDELIEKKENLGEFNKTEYLTEDLLKTTTGTVSKNNCFLVFPIGEKYENVKNLRGKMKKAGEPVQEIFKLILNSTYGILASLVMTVNNPIAANWITSCARAAAWRMTNSLNGCNPITDGTAVNGNTIPFGMTFHEVLAKYPNYLTNYEASITNNVELNFTSEDAFSDKYIEHLENFIGKSDWLTQMYAYDLKDEKDSQGNKHYHYDKHLNTNAGNYVKMGEDIASFKARSYRKTPELLNWFSEVTSDNYKEHLIYSDKSIIKLAQGSEDVIRIVKDAENVANLGKKSLKMPDDLAHQIVSEGLCHPMGFSKSEVKVMKLISPSQFLCQDDRQFRILNSFYESCKNISKEILPSRNWSAKNFGLEKLQSYKIHHSDGDISKVEFRDGIDYAAWNKFNPVGLGFELLLWGNSNFNSLNEVRNKIQKLIWGYNFEDEKYSFIKSVHWVDKVIPNLKKNVELKHFLAAVQIAKLNFELDYRYTLANSTQSPVARVQFISNLSTLREEKTKSI